MEPFIIERRLCGLALTDSSGPASAPRRGAESGQKRSVAADESGGSTWVVEVAIREDVSEHW